MKNIESVRTHDKFYLTEDRKHTPKEYFKFIFKEIDFNLANNGKILDVGCSTGDFLWFLKENLPNAELVGIDVDEELLQRARKEVPGVEFIRANIIEDKLEHRFDLIFMLGVHSIFDKIEQWLDPMVDLLKENKESVIYVFGFFNPEDLDVLIRSRSSSTEGPWEAGWNLYSRKSVMDYCEKKNWKCSFLDFQIEIDIPKNEEDPLRSYTILMKDDKRLVMNGMQLVQPFGFMVIKPYL